MVLDPETARRATTPPKDPYLWLEEVLGERPLDWVRAENERTNAAFATGDDFENLRSSLLGVLDTDAKLAYVRPRAGLLYNFWRDREHVRGIWRRTSLESYRSGEPDWEILIDVDALATAEDKNWVWKGADLLRPGYERALVSLSRGGADAATVREFDMRTGEFISPEANGFVLAEAKSEVHWVDADTLFVGTDLGPGSLTDSGYPRTIRRWRRGTALADAPIVFEGETGDVVVTAWSDPTLGFERCFVERAVDFYRSQRWLLRGESTGDELIRIDTPEDAETSVRKTWLLVFTRSPWQIGRREHPTGTLLCADVDAYLDGEYHRGERELTVLFSPDAHTSLENYQWTANHLVLVTLHDVQTHVTALRADSWEPVDVAGLAPATTTDIIGTDRDHSDEVYLSSSGYLRPPSIVRLDLASPRANDPDTVDAEELRRGPEFFDTAGLRVDQHFATSLDGTAIPYFVVRASRADGPAPTLLYGYGGFENSMTPSYGGLSGRGWIARGGTYVVANIRGGGEYGPEWHTQTQKAGRHKVYEDFAAVAHDLVDRDITTPDKLGAQGGSNGGLLMGVMLTRYPELFGAIVCQVPLLDMYRYPQLPAGASWMAEYGDPTDPDEWAFLEPYSPYQNVRADAQYPPILITTSTRDDRVHPGHARKMAARLREQGHRVWYFENIEGGHGGAADNAQQAFKSALAYGFLWRQLSGEIPPAG